MWREVEALHAVVYFDPAAATAYEQVGLRGWWMGYFASRAAAFGPVGPAPVAAAFHGFAPPMVARALPDAWELATPQAVLAARLGLADGALRRALAHVAPALDLGAEADLAWALLHVLDHGGRVLGAAHAAVARDPRPHLALWQALTALREWRGDGHVAALLVAGIDGCEANVLAQAAGAVPDRQRGVRGWTEGQWAAAGERLAERGWLDRDGVLTAEGTVARDRVQEVTDRLSAVPGAAELRAALAPLAQAVVASGAVPYPNPTGVPAP